MTTYEYKQERIVSSRIAERLNALQAEGWEYMEIVEHVSPPTYRNGVVAGPGMTIILLRRQQEQSDSQFKITDNA